MRVGEGKGVACGGVLGNIEFVTVRVLAQAP